MSGNPEPLAEGIAAPRSPARLRLHLYRALVALLCTFLALKSLGLLRFVSENGLAQRNEWRPEAGMRAFVGLIALLLLAGVFAILVLLRRCYPRLDIPLFMFACAGWGLLLALFLHDVGARLTTVPTRLVLLLPGGLCLAALLLGRGFSPHGLRKGGQRDHGRSPSAPRAAGGGRKPGAVLGWFSVAILAALILEALLWLVAVKPPAAGDEVSFWWSSVDYLQRHGLSDYMLSYPSSSYPIGYTGLSTLFLAWTPVVWLPYAQPVLPLLFGLGLVWLVLVSGPRVPATALSLGFLSAIAAVLLFQHRWIATMFFKLWYGEAMAITSLACMFLLFFHHLRRARGRGPGLIGEWGVLAFQSFGLGAMCLLSKPPLSTLVLPAVIPCLAVVGGLAEKPGRRRGFLALLTVFAAGSLAARLCFYHAIDAAGGVPFYSVSVWDLLEAYPEHAVRHLIPYFIASYKNVWIVFAVAAAIALLRAPRRYAPSLLVASGLALSVLVLYLTVWHAVEYESGGRYLLTALYGWILFFVAVERRHLLATIGWLLRRLRPGARKALVR